MQIQLGDLPAVSAPTESPKRLRHRHTVLDRKRRRRRKSSQERWLASLVVPSLRDARVWPVQARGSQQFL